MGQIRRFPESGFTEPTNRGQALVQGGRDLYSLFLGSRIREPKPRGFDSIRMVGFMSAALPFSAPSARQTRAARAHAAASTRSCPPREFHEVAGTARGATLALGAVPRGLGPCEAEPPRARESGNASGRGVVHGAGMRALRAAAYVKKRRNCSLVGGGEASMHSRGSLAVAEEQDDSVPSPRLRMASGL